MGKAGLVANWDAFLAVGPYVTADGGALQFNTQAPASIDGNGNIEAAEYVCITTILKGDVSEDRLVDVDNIGPFVSVLLGEDTAIRYVATATVDDVDSADEANIQSFVKLLMGL